MKKLLVGSAFLLASITLSIAADAPSGHIMPVKNPAATPFSWNGFYVGGSFGVGIGDGNVTNNPSVTGGLANIVSSFPADGNSRSRGFMYGGQVGFNRQINWAVLGIEVEFDGSTIKSDSAASSRVLGNTASATSSQNLKWLSLVQGRLGYAAGHWMPFISGGLAFGKVQTDVATSGRTLGINCLVGCGSISDSQVKTGWTIGGGVEAALNQFWSFKAQYNYVDLGSANGAYNGTGTTLGPGTTRSSFAYNSDYRFHIIKAGINYHF